MRPHGHARVDPRNPEAFGECDRCGRWFNHVDLSWQFQWAGTHLQNLRILVCRRCLDVPQEQLRTIILPPDPPPIMNARVPDFAYEEQTPRILQNSDKLMPPRLRPWGSGPAMIRCTQDGTVARVLQYSTSS